MNYLAELRKLLEDKLIAAKEHVAGGGAGDFAEYRHLVGVREGLEHALVEVVEMMQRVAKSEESE